MLSTAQAAQYIGISKNTLLRWLNEGLVDDVKRDWRGWRVWHSQDVERVKAFRVEYHNRKTKRLKRRTILRTDFAKAASQSMAHFARGYSERQRIQSTR